MPSLPVLVWASTGIIHAAARGGSGLGQIDQTLYPNAPDERTRDRLTLRAGHATTNGAEAIVVIKVLGQLADFSAMLFPRRVRSPPPRFSK